MKNSIITLGFATALFAFPNFAIAQPDPPIATPNSTAVASSKMPAQIGEISRERREQAYAKVLEGQKYLSTVQRLGPKASASNGKLAKAAFQKAIELDPSISEAYVALAEIAFIFPPNDIDETIRLAGIASALNPNSFIAYRWQARMLSLKSNLKSGTPDTVNTPKAIAAWKEVARIDPRNAEAWAFLNEFYQATKQNDKAIDALRNLVSSISPLEKNFYAYVTGGKDLSPESATVPLGTALVKSGKTKEAIDVLSRAVVDEPENPDAIDGLQKAIEQSVGTDSASALQSLTQAVYANPSNPTLIQLLARTQAKNGKLDDAVKTIKKGIDQISEDKESSAELQTALAQLLDENHQYAKAISAYEDALKIREIGEKPLATDNERDFAFRIMPKIIEIHQANGQFSEAEAVIKRIRFLFGKDDLVADLQMFDLLRAQGKRIEALQLIRSSKLRVPKAADTLLRQEASVLTEMGRVDEAVGLLSVKIVNKGKTITAQQSVPADFNNYLLISALYTQAKRGPEAIAAAQKGLNLAQTVQVDQWKRAAMLTLASAQNTANNFDESEKTLKEILKTDSTNTTALNNYGYFLLERNERFPEALEMIQKAQSSDPTNSSFLDSLGWAYFKLGNLIEAEKALSEAARRSTGSATIIDHLGDLYAKQGKLDTAKDLWRKALNLSSAPDDMARISAKLGINSSQKTKPTIKRPRPRGKP